MATDSGVDLRPDPRRVVARLFVPGREDSGVGDSRAVPVIDRLLHLDSAVVDEAMRDLDQRFEGRHRDLHRMLSEHAAKVTSRIDSAIELTNARVLLIGASFTHEYSIEGAALCNPSAVQYPVQDENGDITFVMSVRGVGEGHRSSIGFRAGRLTHDGVVTIDAPAPYAETAPGQPGAHRRSVFHAKLGELADDRQNAAFVLGPLPEVFSTSELDSRIEALTDDRATRPNTSATIANLRDLAASSYRVEFPPNTELSERVLWPQAPTESHGMEDARFVRFVDDDGSACYYGTYTAYNGTDIAQHLLTTTDFLSFTASPMAGPAAIGKGLALFPRRIGGQYVALSRADRETNGVAFSDDLHCWPTADTIQVPTRPWEMLQLGNSGSPIETSAGWLVLTHGVGPMRTYSIGALLLDLDDPRRVIAAVDEPLLRPQATTRDGYVPNVVYSCGGFAHGDTLVFPYGIGDQRIAIATFSIKRLLGSMTPA